MMDSNQHNPALSPTKRGVGDRNKGGEDTLEIPGRVTNLRWQTRAKPPTDHENALADALQDMFAREIYELPEIVAGLNEAGIPAPDGEPWTPDSFEAAMRDLGCDPFEDLRG